jgi:SAM-dependent methyltransferase
VAEIVGLDAAPAHEEALRQRSELLHPAPKTNQIRFALGNLNSGLPSFPDASFDGIVCSLALAFAESKDAKTGRYTDAAYNRVLSDCRRVLGPGGRFVFSVHVQMQRYHRWLRREARRGRFHFFTLPEIVARLRQAGFAEWKSRLSYAGQVYVICALAEAAASRRAA